MTTTTKEVNQKLTKSKNGTDQSTREVDFSNALAALEGTPPSLQQITEAEECYGEYQEVIDIALKEANQLLASPEGTAKVKVIEQLLASDESTPEAEKSILSLFTDGYFDQTMSAAQSTGLKAIGLGVAASFNLICLGCEKGIEGIWLIPQNKYGIIDPNQFTSRGWKLGSVGLDLIASAGISLSFWFKTPTTQAIVGSAIDLVPIVGARFSYIKTMDKPDERPTRPFKKPNATYAGFSIRLSVGLELGAVLFGGGQAVPAGKGPLSPDDPTIQAMTLSLLNESTGTPVIEMGQTTVLEAQLFNPENGPNNPVMFNSNGTQTILKITMPDFLQATVDQMTLTELSNWQQQPSESGTLVLAFTGPANTVWEAPLAFMIGNVKSDSTTQTTSRAVASLSDYAPQATTQLELVPLVFNASIDWEIDGLGGDIVVVDGDPTNGTNVQASTPPTDFVQLTQVVDNSGAKPVTWNLGYVFNQQNNDGNIVPMMQAVWWKDGTSWSKGQKYVSMPWAEITSTEASMTAYFGTSSTIKLVISAVLSS